MHLEYDYALLAHKRPLHYHYGLLAASLHTVIGNITRKNSSKLVTLTNPPYQFSGIWGEALKGSCPWDRPREWRDRQLYSHPRSQWRI